jgi:hypothetical protein
MGQLNATQTAYMSGIQTGYTMGQMELIVQGNQSQVDAYNERAEFMNAYISDYLGKKVNTFPHIGLIQITHPKMFKKLTEDPWSQS